MMILCLLSQWCIVPSDVTYGQLIWVRSIVCCAKMHLHISAYQAEAFFSSMTKTEHQWGWLPSLHHGYQTDSDLVKLNTNHPGVKRKEEGLFHSGLQDIFTTAELTPTTLSGTRKVVPDSLPGATEPYLGAADQACVLSRRRWTSW